MKIKFYEIVSENPKNFMIGKYKGLHQNLTKKDPRPFCKISVNSTFKLKLGNLIVTKNYLTLVTNGYTHNDFFYSPKTGLKESRPWS